MTALRVTFYSYKGGVGRSLALLNVAAVLARAGKKVVAIDMDLEAPGFGLSALTRTTPDEGVRPGVSDLIFDYLKGHSTTAADYLYSVPEPQLRDRLRLLSAGTCPVVLADRIQDAVP